MEQNNSKGNIENDAVEAEGGETFEETAKREKVCCLNIRLYFNVYHTQYKS